MQSAVAGSDLEVLRSVESRVLWLAISMVHHANHVRPVADDPATPAREVKVGGHQASSASIVSLMTALWFESLTAADRVSVKPHASPVLHALNYVLGDLDVSYLTELRALGGLQSYPSRTKDPGTVDYSTGSVGIGATAPIWAALSRRYAGRFGVPTEGRQISLVGDAELDEGACWEAIVDPTVGRLGEVLWVVDLNRQSLDRVVPQIAAERLAGMFAAAGWQVLTCKYGRLLTSLFEQPGGAELRARIDSMGNPEYQRLLRSSATQLRERLPGDSTPLRRLVETLDDAALRAAVRDLGGHDLAGLRDAFGKVEDDRPSVVLAYTIKGWSLPTEGHPSNHSALLSKGQYAELAATLDTSVEAPWQLWPDGSPEAALCARVARRLARDPIERHEPPGVPADLGRTHRGTASTQAGLGRVLVDLHRDAPDVAARVVTCSPDVASSTNLAGWLNKVGIYASHEETNWFADDAETRLHWREHPDGQHIELGIAEVNLVGLLGELGATWSRWGQPLLPIGTLYDPFVNRALEPWSYGVYAGGQSILVGTPSGVTLAPEGGAHQSITTPSLALEQPGVVGYEPAFTQDLEWVLLRCLSLLGRPGGTSAYLRLSTRPIEQAVAAVPSDPGGRERRRDQVVRGGYVIREQPDAVVTLVAQGVLVVEALRAADALVEHGVAARVVCVTSADLLFRAVRRRRGLGLRGVSADPLADEAILAELFDRPLPLVTVLDGHPHTLAFLGSVHNTPSTPLGVTAFGQVGTIAEVYDLHGIGVRAIVDSALDLVD
ncbi:MAG: pyruvate dehydrogenase [Geodermatophilaceae bacterium]|nr:pyruvate dehydrogenase [Geodermatophilaceae bacterium]